MDITARMAVSAMLMLAFAASCTMVEFTGSPLDTFDDMKDVEKSHTTRIMFDVEWPAGIPEEDMPNYITVVMNRIQNSAARYVIHLDGMGNVLDSAEIPEEPGTDEPGADTPGTEEPGTEEPGTDVPETEEPEPEEPETEEPGTGNDESGNDESGNEDGGTGAENGEASEFDEPAEGDGNEGNGEDGNGEESDGENTDGEGDTENENTDNEGWEPEEGPAPDGPPAVRNGFYSIAAVAVKDFNDFIVPAIEEFADSLETSMRDVNVTIPLITREEKIEKDYVDYNPVYPYIKSISPIYYVRPSVKTHTEIWTDHASDIKTVTLKPQPLTRRLKVKLPLEVEDSVTVDRIIASISGVPRNVQLMTGYVSEKGTGKMPIEFTSTDGKNFEGEINIFGLFAPKLDSLFVGPGILTLTIQASTEKDGRKYSAKRPYNLNMKQAIEAAEIMILTEDRSAYRFSDTENTDAQGNYLEVKSFEISVTKEQTDPIRREDLIIGKGQGFNQWVPIEDNEDKDKNPGLNPEV